MQATPTPRFIDLQLEVPEFTHVSDAENFLAKIALLCARGHLDIQSAQELSGLVKTWIDSQYAKDELQFKINPPEQRDTTIQITGGLPALPGTNITMPVIGGKNSNGHALEPPSPVIVENDGMNSNPSPAEATDTPPSCLKAQGPHPLQEHHFAAPPEEAAQGKNSSTNGGQEPTDQGP
jgi:hypothetical protein